jgi:hypothetical protein
MKLKYGNLWDSTDDVLLVTANSYITKDNRLVMGRGAALEMKTKIDDIDKHFGYLIQKFFNNYSNSIVLGRYGVIIDQDITYPEHKYFGIFQVKYHFKDKADLELVRYSVFELMKIAQGYFSSFNISMNFPAIGCGGLNFEDVLPVVSILPDNVTLYLKE